MSQAEQPTPDTPPIEAAPKTAPNAASAKPVHPIAPPPAYFFNIYPQGQQVPEMLAKLVDSLELSLGMPVWFLVQRPGGQEFSTVDVSAVDVFFNSKTDIKKDEPIALVIDSPGGSAKAAYQIAMAIRRRCGKFVAVVPRYAKSAATLLALGAEKIIMSQNAELGPLDVQIYDEDRERMASALDEVQALQRLHAFALESFDRSMMLMAPRTGKRLETLLPTVLHFVTEMTEPLFNKIDAVHYSQMARALKVGEEYAIRLLQPKYSKQDAQKISRHMVENYPEHGFVIDHEEALHSGLETVLMSDEQEQICAGIMNSLKNATVIGKIITKVK